MSSTLQQHELQTTERKMQSAVCSLMYQDWSAAENKYDQKVLSLQQYSLQRADCKEYDPKITKYLNLQTYVVYINFD